MSEGSREVPAGSRGVPVEDGSRIETEYAGEQSSGHPVAGHPPDPNEGVVRATPPDARALLIAAGVAALTLLTLVLLAMKVS